ncbi:hypothetical protein BDK51DRAFT_40402 [Blyttiomyces helicus]|uniref:Uncharacterized protein n=1 Tax=Blyttiomyces helicus TaxID=388810 RepID=A0A4P9WHD7_9FUNG|nr:hypothetical protein BDK51DRAFT_40402 [Blyttiomyces helicus]|eukprot:RKO92144.1 hypothetical protein BDK51DRAFT_40402 [Blyttiomyces helicus]
MSTCGYFQGRCIMCNHALAVIRKQRLSLFNFSSGYYQRASLQQAYAGHLTPIIATDLEYESLSPLAKCCCRSGLPWGSSNLWGASCGCLKWRLVELEIKGTLLTEYGHSASNIASEYLCPCVILNLPPSSSPTPSSPLPQTLSLKYLAKSHNAWRRTARTPSAEVADLKRLATATIDARRAQAKVNDWRVGKARSEKAAVELHDVTAGLGLDGAPSDIGRIQRRTKNLDKRLIAVILIVSNSAVSKSARLSLLLGCSECRPDSPASHQVDGCAAGFSTEARGLLVAAKR